MPGPAVGAPDGRSQRASTQGWPKGTVVGIEATFPALWLSGCWESGHQLWVGMQRGFACEVRQQKTDTRDAEHLLDLLRTGRFPRIWVPLLEERDLRQL